jgi:hypothetical protein
VMDAVRADETLGDDDPTLEQVVDEIVAASALPKSPKSTLSE